MTPISVEHLASAEDPVPRGYQKLHVSPILRPLGSGRTPNTSHLPHVSARDAWTLIAWVEGIAFYALADAGGAAVPSLAELRAQVTALLAALCGDGAGAA